MKIGFIGLGHLGSAMARRLIEEGVDLVAWNRTKEKAYGLGVEIADSPAALLSKTEMVFMSLYDSDAVNSVLTGLLEGDCRGKIIIDTTTNHFGSAASFHEVLKEHGASYLEAPVLGSVIPATLGALTILVSGKKESFEKAKPYLKKLGNNIFFLEKPGLASKMKLINNLVLGSFMATIAEAVVLGEKAGLDKALVLDILSKGAGDSMVLNAKKEKLLKEDFSTHFSSAMIYKDLHYMQDLAKTLKMPLFTGSFTKELFAMTFQKDMDSLDFSVIYRLLKGSDP